MLFTFYMTATLLRHRLHAWSSFAMRCLPPHTAYHNIPALPLYFLFTILDLTTGSESGTVKTAFLLVFNTATGIPCNPNFF